MLRHAVQLTPNALSLRVIGVFANGIQTCYAIFSRIAGESQDNNQLVEIGVGNGTPTSCIFAKGGYGSRRKKPYAKCDSKEYSSPSNPPKIKLATIKPRPLEEDA